MKVKLFFSLLLIMTMTVLRAVSMECKRFDTENIFSANEVIPNRSDEERRLTEGENNLNNLNNIDKETVSKLAEEREEPFLELDHFRSALDQYPEATRLVIVEDRDNNIYIQPHGITKGRLGSSKDKADNLRINEELRELLLERHNNNEATVNSWLSESEFTPLSAQRLRDILAVSDETLASLQASFHTEALKEAWNRDYPLLLQPLVQKADDVALTLDQLASANNEHDKLALRTKVMETLKAYEDAYQKINVAIQEWISNAQRRVLREPVIVKETVGAAINAMTENTKKNIAASMISSLDFSTAKDNAFFWTGYALRNQETAIMMAKSKGKSTLEMTQGGGFLDSLGLYSPDSAISHELPDLLFDIASEKFATLASGEVTAVIVQSLNPRSVYARIEKPILQKKSDIYLNEEVVSETVAQALWQEIDKSRLESKKMKEIDRQRQEAFKAYSEELNELRNRAKKYETRSDEAKAAGKTEESKSWDTAKEAVNGIAAKLAKAMEVEATAEKLELAKKWREAATLQERSLEPALQAVRAYEKGKTNEGKTWIFIATAFYHTVEGLGKAIEAEAAGKLDVAEQWRDVAMMKERSIAPYTQAIRAYETEKIIEGEAWFYSGGAMYSAGQKLEKAVEAKQAGKLEEAEKWRDAAEMQQRSVEFFTQAVQAYRTENIDNAKQLDNLGIVFLKTPEKLGKAIEAEGVGNLEVAKKWREIAELKQRSLEPYTKATQAHAEGKKEEGDSWHNAGLGFDSAADKLEKALEADLSNKPEIAFLWREAAELQKQSVEFSTRASQARALGKKEEGESWHYAGLGFFNGAKKLEIAIEADLANKPQMASLWRNVAKLKQQTTEPFTQAAKVYAAGKKQEEAQSWYNVGRGFAFASDQTEKALEAEIAGMPWVASLRREAAKVLQKSIDPLTNGAQAHAAGKTEEGQSWHAAGFSYFLAAQKLEKAIEADLKNRSEMAQLWREAAVLQQEAVRYYTDAARSYAVRKTNEGQRWNNAGSGFYNAADKLGKAIEAELAGKPEIAEKWRQVAELQQRSIQPFTQAAQACAAGKTNEGEISNNVGSGFYHAADKLGKAIEAELAGKLEIAQKWSEAAELQQRSIEPFIQAAQAYAAGKTEEGEMLYNLGSGFYHAAQNLGKAIEAEQTRKPEVAQKWRNIATLSERSIDSCLRQFQAYEVGKTNEINSWHNVFAAFRNAALKLEKAIEAEQAAKLEVAQKWRNTATIYERSIEPYTQAAQAYAAGKTEEGSNWFNVGLGFFKVAEGLVKLFESEVVEQPEVQVDTAAKTKKGSRWFNINFGFSKAAESLAKGLKVKENRKLEEARKWSEALRSDPSALYHRALEPYTQAARAYSAGKANQGNSWYNTGFGFYNAGENLARAVEAEENGKLEEANKWREVVFFHEQSTEPYHEAIRAYQEEKKEEGDSWFRIGKCFEWKADGLKKAIQAEQNNKTELAAAWRQVAALKYKAIEFYTHAITAYTEGKKEEGQSWHHIGLTSYFAAFNQGDALEAEQDGRLEKAKILRSAAELQRHAIEPFTQAVQAYATGKVEEGRSCYQAGLDLYNEAENLKKSIGGK